MKPKQRPSGMLLKQPCLSICYSATSHSLILYSIVRGLLLSSRALLGTMDIGATARADIEGVVGLIVSYRFLSFVADLSSILSDPQISSEVLCVCVLLLVPGVWGIATCNVMAVPPNANGVDSK